MIFIAKKTISVAHKPKSDTLFHRLKNVFDSDEIKPEDISAIIDNGNVLQIFDGLTDMRKRPGSIRYQLDKMLMLTMLAIVSDGSSCPHSIADHIWTHSVEYAAQGLIPDENTTPSHDTVEALLSMVNPDELNECLIQTVYEYTGDLSSSVKKEIIDILQFDGKELTGTGRGKDTLNPSRNTNMVNMYSPFTGICLASIPADSKSNEKPTVQSILSKVDLYRRWISFDALHTSDINLDFISYKKGWYMAPIKKNQKLTLKALENMFSDPKMQRYITEVEGHDRRFQVIKLTGKRKLENFPSAKLALKMVSEVRGEDDLTEMYFITNSSDIEKAVYVAENRWEIETMHKLKDSVLMNEDDIRIRNKTAQTNLAIINNFISVIVRVVMSTDKRMTLARAKKTVRAYPLKCFKLVCGMISSEDFSSLLKSGLKKETLNQLAAGNLNVQTLIQKE